MIQLKYGVDLLGLKPEAVIAVICAASVLREHGYATVVTSVSDGTHGRASLHYAGLAIDLRTSHIPEDDRGTMSSLIADALGAQFDVVLEETHIHIEFQPKVAA